MLMVPEKSSSGSSSGSFIAIVVAELAASIVLLQICLDGAKSQMVIAIRRAPQMLDGHEDKRASIRVVRQNDYTK